MISAAAARPNVPLHYVDSVDDDDYGEEYDDFDPNFLPGTTDDDVSYEEIVIDDGDETEFLDFYVDEMMQADGNGDDYMVDDDSEFTEETYESDGEDETQLDLLSEHAGAVHEIEPRLDVIVESPGAESQKLGTMPGSPRGESLQEAAPNVRTAIVKYMEQPGSSTNLQHELNSSNEAEPPTTNYGDYDYGYGEPQADPQPENPRPRQQRRASLIVKSAAQKAYEKEVEEYALEEQRKRDELAELERQIAEKRELFRRAEEEIEARIRAEEMAARLILENEVNRQKLHEEEEKRRRFEEEAKRLAAEKAEAEKYRQQKARQEAEEESEARIRAEETASRLAREHELNRQKLQVEEAKRRCFDAEEAKRLTAEKAVAEHDRKQKARQEAERMELEVKKLEAQVRAAQKAAEEAKKKQNAEKKRLQAKMKARRQTAKDKLAAMNAAKQTSPLTPVPVPAPEKEPEPAPATASQTFSSPPSSPATETKKTKRGFFSHFSPRRVSIASPTKYSRGSRRGSAPPIAAPPLATISLSPEQSPVVGPVSPPTAPHVLAPPLMEQSPSAVRSPPSRPSPPVDRQFPPAIQSPPPARPSPPPVRLPPSVAAPPFPVSSPTPAVVQPQRPAPAPVVDSGIGEYYDVELLRRFLVPNIDYSIREKYLSPAQFREVFECSREEFDSYPKWKQTQLKRKHRLF